MYVCVDVCVLIQREAANRRGEEKGGEEGEEREKLGKRGKGKKKDEQKQRGR